MGKSAFAGIGQAEVFETGVYIQPGVYLAEVKKVKQGETRKKREFFVVEMKVLETSDIKAHPVGSDMTWMVMMDQDAALGNIKHFLNVAGDIPLEEISEQDALDAVGQENPLQGTKLRIIATNIKTKAQKDFTKVKFMSADTSAADVQKAKSSEEGRAA